jgi:hypothetical protein
MTLYRAARADPHRCRLKRWTAYLRRVRIRGFFQMPYAPKRP